MMKLIKNEMIKTFCNKHQHGFTGNRSCVTNLLESLDILTAAFDNSSLFVQVLLLLDFAKAFDPVPYEELIIKLKGYRFKGRMFNWLTDFLSNRSYPG